jgi:hypothetical protein
LIQSEVAIHLDAEGKIAKVEDKWDGKLPDSSIANVSHSTWSSCWDSYANVLYRLSDT